MWCRGPGQVWEEEGYNDWQIVGCVEMVVRQGVGGLDHWYLALVAHDVVDCGESRVGLTFKGV